MSSKGFEKAVLDKLSSIEGRLSSIEESLSGIGEFASDIISDESGPLNTEVLESLKTTLTALSAPIESLSSASANSTEGMSLDEVMGSLSDFRDRIAGIREVMANQADSE